MSNRTLVAIFGCVIVLIIILIIFRKEQTLTWFSYQYLKIIYAAVLAIISGLIIEFTYRKYSHKSKFSKNTKLLGTEELLGKLTLPNGEELAITQYEQIFGRDDFIGVTISEKLLFIGKEHFKLTQKDDGFCIEDLKTKNGTKVNDEEINAKGKVKLKNGYIITVANIIKIIYNE